MLLPQNKPALERRSTVQLGKPSNTMPASVSDTNTTASKSQHTTLVPPAYSGQIFGAARRGGMPRPATGGGDSSPTALQAYLKSKDVSHLDAVLKELDGPMRHATRKYAGTDDPIAVGHAKRIIADSIGRYDPGKASVETFVDRQLQGLQRWSSRRKRVLKTPDRVQVEAARLGQAERRLELELGTPPSMRQLSDETGLPLAAIKRIRSAEQQVFASSLQGGQGEGDQGSIEDSAVVDDQQKADAWIKYVRDDLNPVDQYVLEHTLGLDGAKVLSNQVLAAKLKISPGALSQRKARIQAILDKQETASPFG